LSDYEEALARVELRRQEQLAEQHIYIRARALLRAAGWSATKRELFAASRTEQVSSTVTITDRERSAVVHRALELQQDPNVRGRHVCPDMSEEATMPGKQLPATLREKIKGYVATRRTREPHVRPCVLLAEVIQKFDVQMSEQNFRATYWGAPSPDTPQGRPTKRRSLGMALGAVRKPAVASPPETQPATTPTRAIPTQAAAPPQLLYTVTGLAAGAVLVRLEVVTDPPSAAAIGQLVDAWLSTINRKAVA
jgi:hypothetical protein